MQRTIIRRQTSRKKGFTLVELLVVIGIIAILAGILFPVFASARRKGRQTHCMSNLHQIVQAVKMYYTDEREYPRFLSDLFEAGYLSGKDILLCRNDSEKRALSDPNFATYYQPFCNSVYSTYGLYWNYWGYDDSPGGWIMVDTNGDGVPDAKLLDSDENGIPDQLAALAPTSLNDWLSSDYAGLCKREAPDNTIITRCPRHRREFNVPMDFVVRLNGSVDKIKVDEWDSQYDENSDGTPDWNTRWHRQPE